MKQTEIDIWASSLKKAIIEAKDTIRLDAYLEPDQRRYEGVEGFEFKTVKCDIKSDDGSGMFTFTLKYK